MGGHQGDAFITGAYREGPTPGQGCQPGDLKQQIGHFREKQLYAIMPRVSACLDPARKKAK